MHKLKKKSIRYGRTNGPTLIIESFAFKKNSLLSSILKLSFKTIIVLVKSMFAEEELHINLNNYIDIVHIVIRWFFQ